MDELSQKDIDVLVCEYSWSEVEKVGREYSIEAVSMVNYVHFIHFKLIIKENTP